MQFLMDGKQIDFEQFAELFPLEGKVLKGVELPVQFEITGQQLALCNQVGAPLQIEADRELEYHRRFFQKNSKYSQPLAKALGLKRGKPAPKVIDATAGMLGDSLLILSMGMEVQAFERHPVICALGITGLRKIQLESILHCGECLDHQQILQWADVIFFDPMFQTPNEKTAPKKAMQVFRQLVGTDEDAAEVAHKLRQNTSRLVIKRPRRSPMLLPDASICFEGKATSYDVYLS